MTEFKAPFTLCDRILSQRALNLIKCWIKLHIKSYSVNGSNVEYSTKDGPVIKCREMSSCLFCLNWRKGGRRRRGVLLLTAAMILKPSHYPGAGG